MQITFDTTTITDDEVRGIFALLDTVRPEALAVEEPASGEYTHAVATFKVNMPDGTTKTVEGDDPTEPADGNFTPDTDSTGIVWDERIHASSKALNADGTWRTKRGVDKALVAEVEAELRSRGAETFVGVRTEDASLKINTETGTVTVSAERTEVAPPPAPPAPEAPTAPLAPAPTPTAPSPEPVAHVAESVPTPPAGTSPFVALMKRVTTAQGAGKLTQPRVKELLESLDKKSIMDLRTDDDALASFAVLLDGEGV